MQLTAAVAYHPPVLNGIGTLPNDSVSNLPTADVLMHAVRRPDDLRVPLLRTILNPSDTPRAPPFLSVPFAIVLAPAISACER